MSGYINSIYSADRGNQAVALIGGATAQSYDAVGMQIQPPTLVPELPGTEYIASVSPADAATQKPDSSRQFIDNDAPDSLVVKQMQGVAGQVFAQEEQTIPMALVEDQTNFVPELLSRYQNLEQPVDGLLNTPLTNVEVLSAEAATDDLADSSSDLFSLNDFLAEVIQQAQSSQAEFENSFDGSKQNEIRDFIDLTSGELASTLRTGLQENVAGVPRKALGEVVDVAGFDGLDFVTEPVFAIDYFGESAVVINELLGVVTQPIGAFALPSIGASLANPQDEFLSSLQ